jgi:hypothetical protein
MSSAHAANAPKKLGKSRFSQDRLFFKQSSRSSFMKSTKSARESIFSTRDGEKSAMLNNP